MRPKIGELRSYKTYFREMSAATVIFSRLAGIMAEGISVWVYASQSAGANLCDKNSQPDFIRSFETSL